MLGIHIEKESKIFFFLLIILTTNSCGKTQTSDFVYGIEFNNTRKELGLTPLDTGWKVSLEKDGIIWWYPNSLDSLEKQSKAFYGGKMMRIESDTIICESDEFVGPKILEKTNAYLSYVYNFKSDDATTIIRWTYFLLVETSIDEFGDKWGEGNYISKKEADSILHTWGLKYPM